MRFTNFSLFFVKIIVIDLLVLHFFTITHHILKSNFYIVMQFLKYFIEALEFNYF